MGWLVRAVGLAAICISACLPVLPDDAARAADSAAPGHRIINYRLTVHPAGQPPLALYAEEMGHGPPLLLLHGIGGSSYTWRGIAPRLAATHRVIAVDLRGFGRSDKPFDLAYSPHDHAAAVDAFMTARRLAGVTIVGHSYGGLVALLLAMDRKTTHRIVRIVTIDTPAFPQPLSPGVAFLNKPVLPYLALTVLPPELPIAIALMMEKMGFERLTQRDVATYADPLTEPGGAHALIATARQIVPPDFDRIIARYPTITQPALVLACRDDQAVPLSSAHRLGHTLPRARVTVLEGCDHVPPEQAPDAVVAALQAFLGR